MRRNQYSNPLANEQEQQSFGGPLVTNHLRDLDIELELLKRKRDIIQQEQNILNRERYAAQRQYDYEQPSFAFNRQEPKPTQQQYNANNYSQLYAGPSNSGFRPQGVKRQSQGQNWQAPAKRFSTPNINPWQNPPAQNFALKNTSQQSQPKPARYTAPVQAPRPLFKKNYQPPSQRKNFQHGNIQFTNKVTKPKPQQPPNKLSTYPVAQTKKLVATTMKMIEIPKTENNILRPDKQPSAQLKGRLELALGNIMKEIKEEQCTNQSELDSFLTPFVQRLIKHTIRTRIRSVMMDQHIGPASEIMEHYRKKFPKDTDKDLVKVARDAKDVNGQVVWHLIDADDPEEFYKKNMSKLIQNKLQDMFEKLEKLNKAETNIDDFMANLPELKTNLDNKKENGEKSAEKSVGKPKTIEDIIGGEDGVKLASEKISKIVMYKKFMDDLIEQRVPKILPKFKDLLLSIIFCEKEYLGIKAFIMANLKKKIIKTAEKDFAETSGTALNTSKSEKTNTVAAQGNATKPTNASETPMNTAKAAAAKPATATETSAAIAASPTKPSATATNSTDQTSTILAKPSATNPSMTTANETSSPVPTSATETPTKTTNVAAPQTPKTPASNLLYVKLIGRPILPPRAVIYEFLNDFNPASIKKHKSLGNLLVIGFKDRDNFDKILAATDTVIGDCTVIIKASEQVNTPNKQSNTPTPVPVPSAPVETKVNEKPSNPENNSLDDIIPSDIDCEITELLSTIKNTEEPMDKDKGTNRKISNDTLKTNDENNVAAEATDEIVDTGKVTDEKNNDTAEIDEKNDAKMAEDNDISENKKSDEKMDTTEVKTNLQPITEDDGDNKDKDDEPVDKFKANVKDSVPATPTRASSRLANATPSTIKTRRASRATQNN